MRRTWTLAAVAATAALLGSNVLSSQLGAKVGLDEARIETGGTMEEANLVRVRYIMSPKWAVQTETGSTMGADLFYKIERWGD